jgi:hypothetical protein
MSKKSPLQIVREKFGSKDALVEKVSALLEPGEGEDAAAFSARLKRVANAKLLHLLAVGERLRELGGREKLAARIAELKGQVKDADYVQRLRKLTPARLIDLHDSLSRRARRAARAS